MTQPLFPITLLALSLFLPLQAQPAASTDSIAHNPLIKNFFLQQSFVYKNKLFTPNQLYGQDFAQQAYERLAHISSHHAKLIHNPDIVYRLHEFEVFCNDNKKCTADQHVELFFHHLGPHPLPPKTEGISALLGDFEGLQGDVLSFIDTIPQRHGHEIIELNIPLAGIDFPVAGKYISRRFLVFSPTLAQEVFDDTSGTYIKGTLETNLQTHLFYPEAILFMKATDRWKLLNKAFFEGPFNPKEFPSRYGAIFTNNFYWLKKRWHCKEQPFDLFKEMSCYTMRTMAEAFFAFTLSDKQLIELVDAFSAMHQFLQQREVSIANIPLCIPTPANTAFLRNRKTFRSLIEKICKESPHEIEINGVTYPTIVGILHKHRDPNGQALSPEEMMGHISVLFFAGHVTTSIFSTMLLYHLYKSPEWKSILTQEIAEKLHNRRTSWYPMNHLPEYTKFKDEILRMYPSVPMISIDTTKETVLGNYTIPAGSTLLIMESMMSKNPHVYTNGEQFNPHRFEPNHPDYTPTTYGSMVTFVHGQRRCLGQWFAQAEVRSLVAELLAHNLELEFLDDEEPVKLYMESTGRPNRTIWARAHIEESNSMHHEIQDHEFAVIHTRYEDSAQKIKTLRLAPTQTQQLPFDYCSGDHIELFLTKHNKSNEPVSSLRHFSVSSSPTDSCNWIEITVKEEPGAITAPTTSQILHSLTPGNTLELRAPLDDGVRVSEYDPINQPLILISGGIGITPMISITRYLLAKKWPGQIYFVHSAQSSETLSFYSQLQEWNAEYDNFHLLVTLTSEPVDSLWTGHRERINQTMLASLDIQNIHDGRIYICGTPGLCTTISSLCKNLWEVGNDNIKYLSFGVANWKDASQARYSREEVAQHSTATDGWMIIDNFIYDVTQYLQYHPGLDIIVDYLGKDATEIFNAIPHSAHAKKLLTESDTIKIMGIVS